MGQTVEPPRRFIGRVRFYYLGGDIHMNTVFSLKSQ